MPLFEHMPWTNFQNENLDWVLEVTKKNETDISSIQTTIAEIEGNITTINTQITNIIEQIGEIDLTDLEARMDAVEADCLVLHGMANNTLARVMNDETQIESNTSNIATNTTDIGNNDIASQNRDNALSARITQLERAVIHDIYNYYNEGNKCIFGSDLRHLPSSIKDSDGYPIVGWGNKGNANQAGTATVRSFKFVDGGMVANTDSTGYDYYQVGKFTNGLFINGAYTVTIALVTADDATPTWYTHTFSSSTEQWTIATNCIIKIRKFYNWDDANTNHLFTISFMGIAANWNIFLNGRKIAFVYIESGNGSVDTSVTAKPPYDMKEREYFEQDSGSVELPEATIVGTGSGTASVTYYDLVGEPQTINCSITATVTAKKYGKVIEGYLNIRMGLTNNVGDLLARGAQFTLTGLAMSYDAINLPMPHSDSPLRGVANDSKYYAWEYNNTQNTYLFVNISDDGTWNIKLISSGMQNYTGSYNSYTDLRIPIKYIAT